MKTIKIFLASSCELKEEREMMAALANSLNTVLEPQGIRTIVIEWENLDASMGELHKQEDYNKKLRECEMCMVLYWTTFGKYTKTELDVAYNELTSGNNPRKLYVYFKDGEKELSPELREFRDSFPIKYGHFFTEFKNMDTLKAHFLLQFMDYQSQMLQDFKAVELKDGKVLVGGNEYVSLQNVPFAGNNDEYNELKEDILELEDDLAELDHNNPRYKKKSEKLSTLKEKLKSLEAGLWDTALEITRLCTQKCSDRLRRAMDCFNQGDNKAAAAILKEDEIYKDAQQNINLLQLGRDGLLANIEELLLKIKLLRPSYSASPRVVNAANEEISAILTKVIEYASIAFGEYSEEVFKYCRYARFNFSQQPKRRLPFLKKALDIAKRIYADRVNIIIGVSKDLTSVYHCLNDKESYIQHLSIIVDMIREKYGEQSKEYVGAVVDYAEGIYEKDAVEGKLWFEKALSVCRNINDVESERRILYRPLLGVSMCNRDWEWMESIIARLKELSTKDELLNTCIDIAERAWPRSRAVAIEHYEEALSYAIERNDADVQREILIYLSDAYAPWFDQLGNADKRIEYLTKALEVNSSNQEWRLYYELTDAYLQKENYQEAKEWAQKALEVALNGGVTERTFTHPVERSYRQLCEVYKRLREWDNAIENQQALLEWCKLNDVGQNALRGVYEGLAWLYSRTFQVEKALQIYESVIDEEKYIKNIETLQRMGWMYFLVENFSRAEQCFKDAVASLLAERPDEKWSTKREVGKYNREIAEAYYKLAWFYIVATEEYAKAQEALDQSYAFCSRSRMSSLCGRSLWQGVIYRGRGEYQKALEVFEAEPKKDKRLQTEIAHTLLEMGKPTEALEIVLKVVTEHPDYNDAYKVLGLIYKKQNDTEKARVAFEKCIALKEQIHAPSFAIKKVKDLIATL